MFDFDGDHATLIRPPHKAAATPNNWAKDPSGPGANDGTRITASLINAIVGNLRHLISSYNINLPGSADDALKLAILAAIDEELNKHTFAVADLEDGDGYVRMTDAERAKLAALVTNYKGAFATLDAVEAAYPTAEMGDWAVIMKPGEAAAVVLWDADEEEWVETGGSPPQTAAQVPFTPAGNIAATDVQTALQELDEEKAPEDHDHDSEYVPLGRKVETAGLASGGGDLTQNRTITVPECSIAEYRNASPDKAIAPDTAWAAAEFVQVEDAATITLDFAEGFNFEIEPLEGNRLLDEPDNIKVGQAGTIIVKQDATGGRTLAFDEIFVFIGGEAPSLNTEPNAKNVFSYIALSSTEILLVLMEDVK